MLFTLDLSVVSKDRICC